MDNAKRFDPNNAASIIDFAKKLKDQTLRSACQKELENHNFSGKGSFGQLLEKYYFLYNPNSFAEPDFPEVGLELKSSPIKRLLNGAFRSKERLVLNIINYLEIAKESFTESSFWKKNAHLLLVFYLYEKEENLLDFKIKLVEDWEFPEADLLVIKNDWEKIKSIVEAGNAHELSEGSTFYLGACTKGSKGGNLRDQPNNEVKAKQRAFSLKQGYVNHIIANIAKEEKGVYGKIINRPKLLESKSLEEFIIEKFVPFHGKSDKEITTFFKLNLNRFSKNYYANITKAILGIELKSKIAEFEKAEIIVKTVRLKRNGLPKEDISFPNFKYKEITQKIWEESNFKTILGRKFFFVFYQYDKNEDLILQKTLFWNMPSGDLAEVKEMWEETVNRIKEGKAHDLPKKRENRIAHVRPHAKNKEDTFETPDGNQVVKKCFWLNNSYIRDEIYRDPIVLKRNRKPIVLTLFDDLPDF